MSAIHGKDATITIDAVDLSQYLDSMGFDSNVDLPDVTAFGDDDEEVIAGIKSHGLTISGHWDATADAAMWAMFDGALVAWSMALGGITYSGNAFLNRYSINPGAKGKVPWSASLKVTGAVGRA